MDTTPQNLQPAPRWYDRLAFRLLVWLALSAVFTLLVVRYSQSHGKLLCPPFYDDVAYFEDALQRLAVLERAGPLALIPDYLHSPPHSPFSTFMAFAAFRTVGVQEWAPYAANSLIILALLLLLDHLSGPASLFQKLVLALLALSVPVSTAAVYEFRPDSAAALACAAGVALVLWRPFMQRSASAPKGGRGSRRAGLTERASTSKGGRGSCRAVDFENASARQKPRAPQSCHPRLLCAGACFGLAFLFKPPTSPLTFALLCVTLAASAIVEHIFQPHPRLRSLLKSYAQLLLPAILLPLPHYVLTWQENYHYIYDPIFGHTRSVWESHFSRWQSLTYYLRGEGGQIMLGAELYPLAAIIVLGTWTLYRRRQWTALSRLAALVLAAAVAYAIPTSLPMKQPYFGNYFDWLLILIAVYVLCQFTHARSRTWMLLFALAVLCCLHRILFIDRTDNPGTELVLAQNRVAKGLYQALRTTMPRPDARIYMTTTGGVSTAALDFYFRRDTRLPLNIGDNPFSDDLSIHRREIESAEFVIASEPGNGLAFAEFLKSGDIQSETLDLVRQNPDFHPIASFPALNGRSFYLFHRTRPFFGYAASQGLLESPSTAHGLAPRTTLTIAPEGRANLRLIARAISQTPDLQIRITLDSHPLHTWTPPTNHPEDLTLPFVLPTGGPHELELRYTSPHALPSTPILFTRVEIIPDCPP